MDNCRYDAKTAQPVEGSVVDADEDLAELCSRIRSEDGRHCAIVFCEVAFCEVDLRSEQAPSRRGALTH